jgi:hypothetical protein
MFLQKMWLSILEVNAKLNICRDGMKIFPEVGNLTARNGEDF